MEFKIWLWPGYQWASKIANCYIQYIFLAPLYMSSLNFLTNKNKYFKTLVVLPNNSRMSKNPDYEFEEIKVMENS